MDTSYKKTEDGKLEATTTLVAKIVHDYKDLLIQRQRIVDYKHNQDVTLDKQITDIDELITAAKSLNLDKEGEVTLG